VPLGYRRISSTLSGRNPHHKDGANYFVGVVVVVVLVDDVDVEELVDDGFDDDVVEGFTVEDVEEVELLVSLVDEVDPRFVPSSVG
jgi:hypothetical protein